MMRVGGGLVPGAQGASRRDLCLGGVRGMRRGMGLGWIDELMNCSWTCILISVSEHLNVVMDFILF